MRQFLGDVNTALGGGSAIYAISDLDLITVDLNNAFSAGTVSQFALNNLEAPVSVTAVPEPPSIILLATGLLGATLRYNRKRRTSPGLV